MLNRAKAEPRGQLGASCAMLFGEPLNFASGGIEKGAKDDQSATNFSQAVWSAIPEKSEKRKSKITESYPLAATNSQEIIKVATRPTRRARLSSCWGKADAKWAECRVW